MGGIDPSAWGIDHTPLYLLGVIRSLSAVSDGGEMRDLELSLEVIESIMPTRALPPTAQNSSHRNPGSWPFWALGDPRCLTRLGFAWLRLAGTELETGSTGVHAVDARGMAWW